MKMNYFINFQMTIVFENLGSGGKGGGGEMVENVPLTK